MKSSLAGERSSWASFAAWCRPCRAEEGCLEYGPTVDARTSIAAQPAVRDNVVVVVEKWASAAALEKHLVAPHMQDYRARVKLLVTKVELRILEPA